MKIITERAIEALGPTHRERYSDLPDGMEQVDEACRLGPWGEKEENGHDV